MKPFLAVCLALLLSGCGSIITVLRDDSVTSKQLADAKSYCGAVPRVYSGVMFDFCVLHAPPEDERNYSSSPPIVVVLDMALSGLVDTVVLPYTFVRQHRDGSIDITR
ncbi:YceK/YidQ family lipoprotein [Pseudomonas putida]